MKKATYEDWIYSAEQELLRLKENADDVAIIGFSMGGLIAVNLACKYDIEAITTINTPIYYWDLKRVLSNLSDDIRERDFKNTRRYIRAIRNSPFAALNNFQKLLKQTKPKLRNIECPFFIIQAKDDDTVRKTSVQYIYRDISSELKNIKYYDKGGHLILRSLSAEQVERDVEEFLNSLH